MGSTSFFRIMRRSFADCIPSDGVMSAFALMIDTHSQTVTDLPRNASLDKSFDPSSRFEVGQKLYEPHWLLGTFDVMADYSNPEEAGFWFTKFHIWLNGERDVAKLNILPDFLHHLFSLGRPLWRSIMPTAEWGRIDHAFDLAQVSLVDFRYSYDR
jgi:hypothetical protein